MKLILLNDTMYLDQATGMKGTLLGCYVDESLNIEYEFQPGGLSQDGMPLESFVLCEKRLKCKASDYADTYIPAEILGTIVTHKCTRYTGRAVSLILHRNGCLHVAIQPKAPNNTVQKVKMQQFDIRDLEGEALKKLTEAKQLEKELVAPSPSRSAYKKEKY